MQIVNIIAGGNSVKDMDVTLIKPRGFTIGVNTAAIRAPVDMGLSMDRKWADHYHNEIKDKPFWLRRHFTTWEQLYIFPCDHETDEFSEMPGVANGKSSGHCALNLAYHIRPEKLFLFGYDFSGEAYWHGPHPWSKGAETTRVQGDWVKAFAATKKYFDANNIDVTVVGRSNCDIFKKISFKEYLECQLPL